MQFDWQLPVQVVLPAQLAVQFDPQLRLQVLFWLQSKVTFEGATVSGPASSAPRSQVCPLAHVQVFAAHVHEPEQAT